MSSNVSFNSPSDNTVYLGEIILDVDKDEINPDANITSEKVNEVIKSAASGACVVEKPSISVKKKKVKKKGEGFIYGMKKFDAGCFGEYVGNVLHTIGEKLPLMAVRNFGRVPLAAGGTPFPRSTHSKNKIPFSEVERVKNTLWNIHDTSFRKRSPEQGSEGFLRHIMACLMEGSDDNIREANSLLRRLGSLGGLGTGHLFNPDAGYDFEAAIITSILWQYKEKLDQETKEHLINVVLNFEAEANYIYHQFAKGNFEITCPNTLGLIEDSENHTWMILSSLYLYYKFKEEAGMGNSDLNKQYTEDLKSRILNFIEYSKTRGFHEFNSRPYIAYTLHPLLNLEAFASDEIRAGARELLDISSYAYALRSIDFKAYSIFCRLFRKAEEESFDDCHQSAYFQGWTGEILETGKTDHRITAFSLPYRPSLEVMRLVKEKTGYVAFIGHNRTGEVHAAGDNGKTLISGGAKDPRNNPAHIDVVVRPITLLVKNGPHSIRETLSIGKKGKCQEINNTGVYKNFAISKASLQHYDLLPLEIRAVKEGQWQLFKITDEVYAATFEKKNKEGKTVYSLMAAFEEEGLNEARAIHLFNETIEVNSISDLKQRFQFPEGGTQINYSLDLKNEDGNYGKKYPITSVKEAGKDLRQLEGHFTRVPLFQVYS